MQREQVNSLLFGEADRRRFTQDTPVLPEVWYAFAAKPDERHDLLITPLDTISANALLLNLVDELGEGVAAHAGPAALRGFLAISLTFDELVHLVLPRTSWAQKIFGGTPTQKEANADVLSREPGQQHPSRKLNQAGAPDRRVSRTEIDRIFRLLGEIGAERESPRRPGQRAIQLRPRAEAVRDFSSVYASWLEKTLAARPSIWRVALNRTLQLSDTQSRSTVKGDAAHRLFDVCCNEITWAVVDSGIDVDHPAFNDAGQCRIIGSYDFTILRHLLNAGYRGRSRENPVLKDVSAAAGLTIEEGERLLEAVLRSYETDALDWGSIEPLIRLASPDEPADGHGTHVAGIIGANWREEDGTPIVVGLCPDIRLLDLRVTGDTIENTEFAVISSLQFIRNLNARNQYIAVHGVNLSLSIPHAVENYACGRTPVCEECERLVGAGVSVIAAAGNMGWQHLTASSGSSSGYAAVSITDPGNAESVVTVGATHKREPHTYGVSYFSGRGPTGDGRAKPDLLAPGERIRSTLPGEAYGPRDGTSQATPHVSGAAALIMARFPELIGKPARIKQLLCDSATDLGRERMFQGHGLLDVLRALQSF